MIGIWKFAAENLIIGIVQKREKLTTFSVIHGLDLIDVFILHQM